MHNKDRLWLGSIETSNFGANHADLHALNDRWELELLCVLKMAGEFWDA